MLVLTRKVGQTLYIGDGWVKLIRIQYRQQQSPLAVLHVGAPGLPHDLQVVAMPAGRWMDFPAGGSAKTRIQVYCFQGLSSPRMVPQVRIAIDAPKDVPVMREEVLGKFGRAA